MEGEDGLRDDNVGPWPGGPGPTGRLVFSHVNDATRPVIAMLKCLLNACQDPTIEVKNPIRVRVRTSRVPSPSLTPTLSEYGYHFPQYAALFSSHDA